MIEYLSFLLLCTSVKNTRPSIFRFKTSLLINNVNYVITCWFLTKHGCSGCEGRRKYNHKCPFQKSTVILQSVILTYYKQVMLALHHMRSCMTVFDEALNTKLYKLALLAYNQKPKRIALLTFITTNDDVSKKVTSITTNGSRIQKG